MSETYAYFCKADVKIKDSTYYRLGFDGEWTEDEFSVNAEELNIWELKDWKGEVTLYTLDLDEKKALPEDKQYYVVSEYENMDEDEYHIYNDQSVHFGEIKDGVFYSLEQADEGGFFIVNNWEDLKFFADWYAESSGGHSLDEVFEGNPELLKMFQNEKVTKPFIIMWGM